MSVLVLILVFGFALGFIPGCRALRRDGRLLFRRFDGRLLFRRLDGRLFFRRRGKHRIEITFEFSVVDLAFFIGFSAEKPLEVVYGSKRVATPFVEILNRFTVISVKFFNLSSFGKSFAIGRVGNNHPVGKPRGKFAHVRPLKVNHILNARNFGVFPGKFKLLFVDIEAAYANFSVRVYFGRGFFLNLVENRPSVPFQ